MPGAWAALRLAVMRACAAAGRECVVPEVSRNRNFGESGANMNVQAFRRYFSHMGFARVRGSGLAAGLRNMAHVPCDSRRRHAAPARPQAPAADFGDLSYLLLPAYEASQRRLVKDAVLWQRPLQSLRAERGQARARPRPHTAPPARPAPADQARSPQVYLVPYAAEHYALTVKPLRIWPFPRTHHRHLARLPWRNATLLLADRRFCPFLPPALRLLPSAGLQPVAGRRAADCTSTCA